MTRTVLVLGTDHRYQRRDPVLSESQHQEFADYVRRLVISHGVQLLAEEYSTQALDEQGIPETTIKRLASSLDIAHCYCDLDRVKRFNLGILQENDIRMQGILKRWTETEVVERIGQSHRVRERFWLERLLDMRIWPALFICGADHAQQLANLLRSKGLDAFVVAKGWSAPSGA